MEIAVRGICYSEINVVTLRRDLHSGPFGGVAPNAHEVLTRILAALKAPGGRIRVSGLYDNVRRPSRMEREAWSRLPFDESKFLRREVGARSLVGPTRHSVLERLWSQPTFDIHGIAGGFAGEGAKTVIPSEATAKVSLRLVPEQRADVVFRQLRRAVRDLAPAWAKVTCRCLLAAEPVLVNTDHPAFACMNRSFEEVEGRGGAAMILAGIGLPDDAPHGPNEKISIRQFEKGARVFGRFFRQMATLHRGCRNTTGADTGERTNHDRKNMARTNQDRADE